MATFQVIFIISYVFYFRNFYNNFDILFLSDCVGDDGEEGTGTDQGSCAENQLCTAAGVCLGI